MCVATLFLIGEIKNLKKNELGGSQLLKVQE
jgi:hypothetical protein